MTRRRDVPRFAHEAMSTVFEILVAGVAPEYAAQAARAAFDEVDRLERLLSRFDPTSEVSRIGRLAPGERLRIGRETYEVLDACGRYARLTGGAFDVNFRAAARLPRLGRRRAPLPPLPDLLRLETAPGGYEAVRPGSPALASLDLDLGAAGKGYALDKALETLVDWGVRDALLHSGTSTVLAAGSADPASDPDGGWPVGIPGLAAGEGAGADGRVLLRDRAVGGSGPEVKGGHIVDPRTGRSVRTSAWAAAPTGLEADVLSTAFAVMSRREIGAFCRARPGVWARVIREGDSSRIWNAVALTGPGHAERRSLS